MSDISFPTPEEFSDWRRANPTRGVKGTPFNCPLAECLRDRGAVNPGVGTYWSDDVNVIVSREETPQWAISWFCAFDAGREINPPNPVTVDEVKPGMRMVDGEWLYSAAWL